MRRIIEDPEKARAFLENLGVSFAEDGRPVFPQTPRSRTAQDMTLRILELAKMVAEAERPLSGIYAPITAIVTIANTPKLGRVIGRRRDGMFHNLPARPFPSLASEFTAQLGPLLRAMQGGEPDKCLRYFSPYEIDDDGKPGVGEIKDLELIAGHRILFFAEDDGQGEQGIDMVARLAKGWLSEPVQRLFVRPTADEAAELANVTDPHKRAEELHDLIAGKRRALTAGFVFLVNTLPEEKILSALEFRLGFKPALWTFCDNAPKTG